MYLYYFFISEHKKEFEKVEATKYNPLGILPKPICKPEGIRDYLRFTLESILSNDINFKDEELFYDKKRLADKLIEMYKKLDCYQKQTEEQRKETIEYIKKDPFVAYPYTDL